MKLTKIIATTLASLAAACGVEGTVDLQQPDLQQPKPQETTPASGTYEIAAYAVARIGEEQGTFVVDDQYATLKNGEETILPNGIRLRFKNGLIQEYAGGLNGTEFSLYKACPTDMHIRAQFIRNGNEEESGIGVFNINDFGFSLEPGQTQKLPDGSNVQYHGSLHQDYAGGVHGLRFDLDC